MKQDAAAEIGRQSVKGVYLPTVYLPLTAAGFWVRVVSVVAASYFTA